MRGHVRQPDRAHELARSNTSLMIPAFSKAP